ncbi:TPA: hypothetical protein N0F65_007757 [Lagenidium giganteum]|uniref:Uncharacterized protein n=1 Tax=Lagenidium giganteum TaxID=4803 RepID=A0AAV2YZW5_9STRA|nr:TPA: hypothetical protein N0F65_007757 [Lagenidium giganteum]
MYPNFKNKSDREQKYKELQKQVEQDQAFENIKQQAYKAAIWAGDAKANTINLTPGQTTVGTQTGPSSSDLMRHGDVIWQHRDEINRQNNTIRSQKIEINSLKRQIEGMDIQFHNAKVQFERLAHEHKLSQRQISLLHKEFEQGRQLYLSLRAAAETIEYERDLTINELDALKVNYANGEEFYNALGEAYRLLQQESAKTSANYDATIEKLKEENATATARILEQQQQMLKTTVSQTASKNIRSNMNTPQALREYMQKMGVEETPAATSFSTVSNNILFVIIDGKLYRRQYGKEDRNLEENTVASREALNGVDPIYTMLAIKHSIPPGVRISDNKLYKQEATEIPTNS